MPISLSKEDRKLLENTTGQARVLAESACKAALENLAVHEKEYRTHMSVEQRTLRNRLRARGRALGDKRDERTSLQGIHHLKELAAYEHWHRLLFTRFLTENHLLITDEANGSVPITLEECEELAPELGARDGFDLACRFASIILPGVFRRDDPVLDLPIALNDQVEMRRLLAVLTSECFQADDALGWTYQYWQAQRKKEVNDSGKKIGADELSPVTQLFTEDYMVEFLLHNTLGAWWAGKLGPIKAASEEEARAYVGLPARDGVPAIVWTYLRFVQDEATKIWFPAAGAFDGWPKTAKLIRLLDPCMGSGHFLVFGLSLLVRLRMEEEQFAPKAAIVAVLKDNIHGLELDERCTQIAAFNVALTAWKLAGYQMLPQLHLACSGLAPRASEEEWLALTGGDERLQIGMKSLYSLFRDAPVLGSLINPLEVGGDLFIANFHELRPLLEIALEQETKDDTVRELAVTAQGMAKAVDILAGQFTLVATNVPYLGRGKQNETLQDHCERFHPDAKADLATCFVERCVKFCCTGCSTALVTPQNWLFLGTYKKLRKTLLESVRWDWIARLGPKGFQTPMWDFNILLLSITACEPLEEDRYAGIDVGAQPSPHDKAAALSTDSMIRVLQKQQLSNPDSRLMLGEGGSTPLLQVVAASAAGMLTGDSNQFCFYFWEPRCLAPDWECLQSTVTASESYGGRSQVVLWENGEGRLYKYAESVKHLNTAVQRWRTGQDVWGKKGVVVSCMGSLECTLYLGDRYDNNVGVISPFDQVHLPAIWAFCSSPQFQVELRRIDQKVNVTAATFAKVPFDLSYWLQVAAEKYPNGLPKAFSSDPTQWLFNGHPQGSDQPLHVAVARLLGYTWPRQTGSSFPDCPSLGPDRSEGLADGDGIVCLPPVNHEQPGASRLRSLLVAALGPFDESSLIAAAGLKGSKSKTLEGWLIDEFFEQHAKLFQDRPFIWHLWDGRADGFHALVNYHKLDHATMQKLTYSYLGDWIQQQDIDSKADKPGAADRLGAAQKLQKKLAAILEGEAPLDIFVRWKPIKDQAEGWHPDLNDGVRQNIRPFLLAGDVGKRGAGLFRTVPLKLKDSDRGNDPNRPKEEYPWFWCEDEPGTDPVGGKEFVGTRWNNVHLTLVKKKGSKA
jgi:hypothetical protein